MTAYEGSLTWFADKPAPDPASKPARKSRAEPRKDDLSKDGAAIAPPNPNPEANDGELARPTAGEATLPDESALPAPVLRPSSKSSGETPQHKKTQTGGLLWSKRLVAAALVALATGIGTGLFGMAYEELKAWSFALFSSHTWTAYITEPNPSCTAFSFADRDKAFDDVGPYEYNWHVMRVGDAWSGEAYKRGANGAEYYLNGINRGSYTIINYSSKKNLDGIGAYILSHRPGPTPDAEYYVGYWVGRECSIQGSPLISCPMVLVHKEVQAESAKKLMPQDRCRLAEPVLPQTK